MWIKKPSNTVNNRDVKAVLNTANVFEVILRGTNVVFLTTTTSLLEHWNFSTEQEAQSEYDEILRRLEVVV